MTTVEPRLLASASAAAAIFFATASVSTFLDGRSALAGRAVSVISNAIPNTLTIFIILLPCRTSLSDFCVPQLQSVCDGDRYDEPPLRSPSLLSCFYNVVQ